MPEFRFNILTREWAIIATERAKRPVEFAQSMPKIMLPEYEPNCPFCPGNEAKAAQEVDRISNPDGSWQTRTIKNRYPALNEALNPTSSGDFFHPHIDGFGRHEVIIDGPKHNTSMVDMHLSDIEKVIETYRSRYWANEKDPRVKHVVIFKNSGIKAGCSLFHPHSQLIATPIISAHTESRIAATREYRAEHHRCMVCDMIREEIKLDQRTIYQNKHFVSCLPYAAISSFHTWIFPLDHHAHFGHLSDDQIPALAEILFYVLKSQEKLLNRPDYNIVIRSAPVGLDDADYHWYISIIPCVSKIAGFEIGSSIYINSSLPEQNALELRNVIDILRDQI